MLGADVVLWAAVVGANVVLGAVVFGAGVVLKYSGTPVVMSDVFVVSFIYVSGLILVIERNEKCLDLFRICDILFIAMVKTKPCRSKSSLSAMLVQARHLF